MRRVIRFVQTVPPQWLELFLVFAAAFSCLLLTLVTGWAEAALRPLGLTLSLRGGLYVFVLALTVGVGIYAARRWREMAALKARYRAIFENVPVGIFQISVDGHFLMANQYVAELFGFTSVPEMMREVQDLGRQFYARPEERAALIAALEKNDVVTNMETQMRRRDGSLLWTLSNVRAARDAGGALTYFEGHVQDITARKESENLYRTLVDQSLVGVGILQSGHYVFANRAAAELFGYTVAELLALTNEQTAALIHADERADVAARIQDRLAGKKIPSHSILHIVRHDRSERWLEANANRIEYRGAPAILILLVDVTERKRAQDEMQLTLLQTAMRQDLNTALGRAGADLNGVLRSVTRIVSGALGDLCSVALVSADGAWVEPKAYAHIQREREAAFGELLGHTRLPVDHPILGRVVTAGEPLWIPRFTSEMIANLPVVPLTDYVLEFGLASYLVVPIRQGHDILGALGVLRERDGAPYTLQDQILLQEFADRSALAIANAQLVARLQTELEARRQAEAALRASVEQVELGQTVVPALTTPDELPSLLDSICERAARLLQTQIGGIYLCEPLQQRVRVVANYNTSRDYRGVTLQYGEGAAGRVVVTGKPLQLANYQTWEGRAQAYRNSEFGSVLAAPLFWQGQVIGVIALNDAAGRVFTDREVKLLELFADQAALTVTAAHLQARVSAGRAGPLTQPALAALDVRAQLDAQTQEIFAHALRDAAALLNRVMDYDQALDEILEMVARSVPYETACVYLRQGARLQVVCARGFEKYGLGEWIQDFVLPADALNFLRLAETTKPLLISDGELWEGWATAHATTPLRSHLVAPIRSGNQIAGMIALDSQAANYYHEEDGVRLAAFADLAAAALNNAELLRQAERRAQQLSLLYDAGLTLNRVLNSRTQLEFLFQIARRMLRTDRIVFMRYAPQENNLYFEMGVGLPADTQTSLRARVFSVTRSEGLEGWVAQRRLPALVQDVTADARWLALDDTVVKAALAVPIEHENELRGVLVALSYQADAFNAQDERMLILLGNQVTAAMELTRLFEAQTHRQHELEILREASLAFAATFDRATLISQILDYALRLAPAMNAHLFLYDDNRLLFGGAKWLDKALDKKLFEPREDGLSYAVARGGAMIVVDRVDTHPLFVERRWGGALVGLPLRSGDHVRAVLNVAYRQPHHFEPAELRALQLLSDQAAIALENARNYAETQRQLHDAQLLHRTGQALTRAMSLQEMLERLADFFMEAVSVQACCISMLDVTHNHLVVMLDRDPILASREAPGVRYQISDFAYLQEFLQKQQTLILQRDAPALTPQVAANMDSFFWKSVLILPLLAGPEVIGVVELAEQRARRDFSRAEIRLTESLSHQAAGALLHARLLEQMNRRVQELAALNRIAYRVSGANSLDALTAIIEEETLALLPSEIFFIALYDAARNRAFFQRIFEDGQYLPPFEWDLEPSLTRHVIQTKRVLRLNDHFSEAPPENAPRYYGEGQEHRSWLGAPMRMGEQVVGVIAVENIRPFAYGPAEEQLLQTIADQVAVAVERVRETA